jgi:DNA-binding PadR family transcriptional regulator
MTIEQNDNQCIEILLDQGAMSARDLMKAHPIDQFGEDTAAEWLASALERGLVETTGGSGRSARFNLTDKGRSWSR